MLHSQQHPAEVHGEGLLEPIKVDVSDAASRSRVAGAIDQNVEQAVTVGRTGDQRLLFTI
jgi:hypothetical protein